MEPTNTEANQWFLSWFNSPYYHILYKNRNQDEARDFMALLMRQLQVPKDAKVLDLACGKGRHALELHRLGYEVVGIDIAEESIAEAKKLEEPGLDFFEHDMRQLYWAEHFDAVLNLFTSFGYFHNKEDDQRTINAVRDALKPNGLFVLDFLNVTKVLELMVSAEEKVIDGVRFVITRELHANTIQKNIRVHDGDTELLFTEEVDALVLADFEAYFNQAGMQLEATYGNYALDAFDQATSDRLIMVTRKTQQWEI